MAEILGFTDLVLEGPEGSCLVADATGSLAAGACCALSAPPGAGASRLLAAFAGLVPPRSGELRLGGCPFSPLAFDHPFRAEGRLGWVPTEGALMANLSLLANVALPLRWHRRLDRRQAEHLAGGALQRAGLEAVSHLRPHAVDPRDGWLAALVRTLVSRADLLLLDHPPSGLDTRQLQVAQDLCAALQAQGTALLSLEGPWLPAPPTRTWILASRCLQTETGHGLRP